jgi:UV excision repair protein RAD23
MKITIKNIHQQTFTVEIDGNRKVRDLKHLLANNIPDYPANKQFIIYAGRIMEDDHLLGSYSFDANRFLVVMNREPIQHHLNSTGPPVPSKMDASGIADEVPRKEEVVTTTPIDEQCGAYSNEASAVNSAISPNDRDYIITGTEKYIEICKDLIDMGYHEKDVELAMSKAFNNPERAVEYLLSGE